MSKRAHIGLKTKLCAALCQLVRYDEANAEFVKVIPHNEAKRLTEDEVLSRFDFHHDPIPKAHDGPDVHWNLTPLPKAVHAIITATIDIPRIAKGKRIQRANDAAVNRLLAKDRGERPAPSRWPKRKMQSRNTFERRAAS
jgi:hypothetical protein